MSVGGRRWRSAPIKVSFRQRAWQAIAAVASRRAWRNNVVERIEAFPRRFDGSDTRTRNINRGLGERHGGNIARAIWKNHPHVDADDQLRTDRPGKQRIITVNPCAAVDAQSLRAAVHGNEQKPDMRIDRYVAEALEPPVAVIIRKCKFGRTGHANASSRAALEWTIRMS